MKMNKGVIFFDLDDTLWRSNDFMVDARNSSFKAMICSGLESNLDELWRYFWNAYEIVGPNSQEHFKLILNNYNVSNNEKLKYETIGINYYRIYREKNIQKYLFEGVDNILLNLQTEGYDLGILSAGIERKQLQKLKYLGLNKKINKKLIGITNKKNEKFYSKWLNYSKENFKTDNIWMIGDRENNDISPSKNVGFKTIRIKNDGRYSFDYKKSEADYKIENIKSLLELGVF